jgi:hypothetical protein
VISGSRREMRVFLPPPVLTWKQRVWRGEKYIPTVLTPEQKREKRAEVIWHAQKGLWHAKRALSHANSNEWREHTLRAIKIYEEMLERNKEK